MCVDTTSRAAAAPSQCELLQFYNTFNHMDYLMHVVYTLYLYCGQWEQVYSCYAAMKNIEKKTRSALEL